MNGLIKDEASQVLVARAEASAWIARLHGPNRSAAMEEGFKRWLAERAENRDEFEGLTEIWDLVAGGIPARGVPRLERWERSAEAEELKALREKYAGRPSPTPRLWATAALLLLVCGALAYRFWPLASYATAIGEQRIVQLDDGTQVSLNSNTKIVVDYDRGGRQIRLQKGEALFQVAKDSKRPFVVTAGQNRVTALGTSFLVRLEGERTSITLVEGKVSVLSPPSFMPSSADSHPKPSPAQREGGAESRMSDNEILLSPGQRLTLVTSSAPKMDKPPLDSVTAWRRGEVVLSDTPLVDAVAEMNRYDKTRIVIASPDIETLAVSGLYHTGDSEGFAQSVVKMYQLKMTEREGRIELERK